MAATLCSDYLRLLVVEATPDLSIRVLKEGHMEEKQANALQDNLIASS